jgi:hypothetical protein
MFIADEHQNTIQAPSGAAWLWFNARPRRYSLFQARMVSAIDMALLTELSPSPHHQLHRKQRSTAIK